MTIWSWSDEGVGTIGLEATGLAFFGLISNPVAWGIGKGVLINGGSRVVYDLYHKQKNN